MALRGHLRTVVYMRDWFSSAAFWVHLSTSLPSESEEASRASRAMACMACRAIGV